MGESVCFDAIARALGLSATRFHHLFAAEMGIPPSVYLRRIRLIRAIGPPRGSATTSA